jgi:hypothetical protein
MEDTLFTIYPFCYNTDIPLTPELECSNHFYIHFTYFEKMVETNSAGELLLYELKTPDGTIVGTPFAPHSEDKERIFVPTWMWDALHDTDEKVICILERCKPSMASMIALEPHTSDLLKCKDPEVALRNAFEQYSCIKKGGTYPLQLEDFTELVWITIPSVTPDIGDHLCIRNVELKVNMLPARDTPFPAPPLVAAAVGGAGVPPPTAAAPRLVRKFTHPPGFIPFSGSGNTLGGK